MANNRFKTPTRHSIFNDMVASYKNAYQNDKTAITDLSEGSEIGTLLNSIAVELEALYLHDALLCDQKYVKTARGYYLDLLACENHITRFNGTQAHGYVTFQLVGSVLTKNTKIPKGTKILHRKNGLVYTLDETVVIVAGSTHALGQVVAELPGKKYNAEPDMLTAFQMVGTHTNKYSVNNYSAITGGTDTETDEELRTRILNSKLNPIFGSIGWYTSQVESIEGVHDVAFVNPLNPAIDHRIATSDGKTEKCVSCTRVCYVNCDYDYLCNYDTTKITDESPEEMEHQRDLALYNVKYWLENQNNLVIGHKFHVEPAVPNTFYFEISAYDNGNVTEEEIVQALHSYIYGGDFKGENNTTYTYPGVPIHSKISKGEIIDVLEKLSGIQQVESIYKLKYVVNIAQYVQKASNIDANNGWKPVPGTSYSEWTDNDGYTFRCKNSESTDATIFYDHLGRKNFIELTLDVDEYMKLGHLKSIYELGSTSNNSFVRPKWYLDWTVEGHTDDENRKKGNWYNPKFTSIIYHSLGPIDKKYSSYMETKREYDKEIEKIEQEKRLAEIIDDDDSIIYNPVPINPSDNQ